MKPSDICNIQCICRSGYAKDHNYFLEEIKDAKLGLLLEEIHGYHLKYAPVGNYPEEPVVIVCGKTTSKSAHDNFICDYMRLCHKHDNEIAFDMALALNSFNSSDMRENLFKYLNYIELFDLLRRNKINYWGTGNSCDKIHWDRLFNLDNEDESVKNQKECGIQFTQACNCALLKDGTSSSEPKKAVFTSVAKCLFKLFKISEKLKLIIFLDTPSKDCRFHQEDGYTNHSVNVKVISITHPSAQNNHIYEKIFDENQENIDKIYKKNRDKLHSNKEELNPLIKAGLLEKAAPFSEKENS